MYDEQECMMMIDCTMSRVQISISAQTPHAVSGAHPQIQTTNSAQSSRASPGPRPGRTILYSSEATTTARWCATSTAELGTTLSLSPPASKSPKGTGHAALASTRLPPPRPRTRRAQRAQTIHTTSRTCRSRGSRIGSSLASTRLPIQSFGGGLLDRSAIHMDCPVRRASLSATRDCSRLEDSSLIARGRLRWARLLVYSRSRGLAQDATAARAALATTGACVRRM